MGIDLLEPVGRKIWAKKKWDEYSASKIAKAVERSEKAYYEPTDEMFDGKMDKSKWKSTIDRKVNYLLARKPVIAERQDELDSLLAFIRETATVFMLRGSLIWIVQGDGESIEPIPMIMNNTIAIYADEFKEEVIAFIRKVTEIEIEPLTGEETISETLELFYDAEGIWHKDTFSYNETKGDLEEVLPEAPVFIEVGKTGTAPLYAYVEELLAGFNRLLIHQDKTVEKNTDPLTEVKGYTGTSDADLKYAIQELSIVKVDGTGGVTVHARSMDSIAIDLWAKRLMQEYYEAAAVVGKDNELSYAQSGKAMDRLFVDMENSARELGAILERALVTYFLYVYGEEVDIVWNTDRPIDDAEIINGIQTSRGLVSNRTLLEQHPWVTDVEEELTRLEEEAFSGMDDLVEKEGNEENIEEDELWKF